MLKPEQVLPFLIHDLECVREFARRFLADAHDPAPATADDFWRAIDHLGLDTYAGRQFLTSLHEMPATDAATARLLDALEKAPPADSGPRAEILRARLILQVRDLAFEQVAKNRERLLTSPHLTDAVRAHLSKRLELPDAPLDDLWQQLLALSEKMEGKYYSEVNPMAQDLICEALARHPEGPARATEYIADPPKGDWAEIFCMEILRRARYRPALDAVLHRFAGVGDADDALREECLYTTPVIGGEQAIAGLEKLIRRSPHGIGMFACESMARIKSPAAEAALARLLEDGTAKEQDIEPWATLGLACLCPSGENLTRVIEQAESGEHETSDLIELCFVAATMTGEVRPEMDEWRTHVMAAEARHARIIKDIEAGEKSSLAALRTEINGEDFDDDDDVDDLVEDDGTEDGSYDFDWDGPEYPDDHPPAEVYAPAVPRTIRRDEPKIGRNDPCPCGSGKKYKKCCLGKDDPAR